jgi:Protein of unknown function (DUF4230)
VSRDVTRSALRVVLKLGVAALVLVAVVPVLSAIGLLSWIGNPFGSDHDERVSPTVVNALADLDELHAATADLQVVVEIEDDTRFLPDFVSGRQSTYLAAGTVDAVVDLGDAVVTQKGEQVTVTLPAVELADPVLDDDRSEVLDRDRGVLDRIGDAFGEPGDDDDLRAIATDELLSAATDTEIVERAEDSARATVRQLFAGAGISDVTITFAPSDQLSS